jgi:phosphohistidine phosphatase
MRDYDRPLDETGRRAAAAVGAAMCASGYVPEVTLCSGARRCRETLEQVAAAADTGRVIFLDRLYSEDAATYLSIVREHGRHAALLLVGHNPMVEDLAMAVAADGDPAARDALAFGFPTSGLAALHFDAGLERAAPGGGRLEAFLTPSGP